MTDRPLEGRLILLGVTGSIAAYKAAELLRLLRGAGADVQVMMSRAATHFIGPLTMETLSGHPVMLDPLELQPDRRISHIVAADAADAVLVAPATARWLGAMANGLADDIITATCLATGAPVIVGAGHGRRHVRAPGDPGQREAAARVRLHHRGPGLRRAGVGAGGRGSPGGAAAPRGDRERRRGRSTRSVNRMRPPVRPAARPRVPPTWRAGTSSSAPAGPRNPSTRCASSATAPAGGWASPSPRPPCSGAPA